MDVKNIINGMPSALLRWIPKKLVGGVAKVFEHCDLNRDGVIHVDVEEAVHDKHCLESCWMRIEVIIV